MPILPPIRFVGATILREGELRQRSVSIAAGRITRGPLPAVDMSGFLILPGIVDMLHLPPTGGDAAMRLRRCRVAAAGAGITTAWVAPHWAWDGGSESPESAQDFLHLLQRGSAPDLRPALRIESGRSDTTARLTALCDEIRPELCWFQNDLARLSDLLQHDPQRFAQAATEIGMAADDLALALKAATENRRDVPRHLCRLAEHFDALATRYGSIGDTGGAMRETHSMIGASLAACPAAHSAAAAAGAMGDPVLLSAADEDRLNDMLRSGLGDAIVSDGHPDRLARLALSLSGADLADLPRIWAMLSARPAEIMGFADRGRLDLACRADLVMIAAKSGRVEATISAGRLIHLGGVARARFAAASLTGGSRIAAE
ncbi:alkylphosphonate utilization protein [Paracoccus ravus]|uniref:alkylphosphonate utilization protein n=1 Tax=Paracoccus ravus TaxID=2447760 RepID=UPI00106EE4ED|nr:alkylphosphonate utilization protein [Paracoccus ravus]